MIRAAESKVFDPRITWGNLITIATVLVGGIWAISEIRTDGRVHETRIMAIEREIENVRDDRKLLREMSGDIKALRAMIEKKDR